MWKAKVESGACPPAYRKWTDEEELELVNLQRGASFSLKETQLGRLEEERKKEFEGSIARMPRAEGLAYLETLKDKVYNSE